jgi:glutathionylspermidine synthase
MDRLTIEPRSDWRRRVESLGLVWHTAAGSPYWNESACYRFSHADIAAMEQATYDLYQLYLAAGQQVVDRRLFSQFGIPAWCEPLIIEAWNAEPPALNYGRLDLGFDGRGPPKLFEFNCDTPTSLLEAAVVQWAWKQEVFPHAGQFNALHEALIAKWRDIAPLLAEGAPVHFSHQGEGSGEDAVTCAYLMDTARAAGISTRQLLVSDIGWDGRRFVDLERREIRTLYHLYPWEWLVKEPFGRHLLETQGRTLWIEPIWKMIWSNKAILPILWDLHPGHPNLLWARRDAPAGGGFACKPILGREGANIQLVRDGRELAATGGVYGNQEFIYQELFDLPDFDGARPVVGSWIVDGAPAGIGVREDGPITGNLARFTPHIVDG